MHIAYQLGPVALATVISSLPVSADVAAEEFGHINRAQLREGFERALPEGLSWVDDQLALDDRGEPYWLPAVRAERSGFYILRHSFRYNEPTRHELGKSGQKNNLYHFYVGKKGTSRVHSYGGVYAACATCATYPAACVGDFIVTPFKVAPDLVQHEFSHKGLDDKWTEIRESMIDELETHLRRLIEARQPQLELTNRMESRFRSLGARMWELSPRISPGPYTYTVTAAFEAKQVGEFNLQFDAPKRFTTVPPMPIRIVDSQTPLRIVLTEYESPGRTWRFPLKGHALRVGDRIAITCAEYHRYPTDKSAPIKKVAISVQARPFALPSWKPFGIVPAKIE
jgi:hypothetical protein